MSTNPSVRFNYSPGVQALIPLFYVAWADKVLTPKEIEVLRKQGLALSFIHPDDQALVESWSNPATPPSRQLFKYWEISIKNAVELMDLKIPVSLADVGLFMAQKAARNNLSTEQVANFADPTLRLELEKLETALGGVSSETLQTIFPDEAIAKSPVKISSESRFDIKKLTAVLDDEYAEVRKRVKTILSDEAFTYRTLRNKDEYRSQVLHWCKLLAQQGLGAMSYPKEYGGIDDMGEYAAVFETLGYHDLSLAIKFGVQFGLFGGSVLWLGTKKHHDQYLEAIGKLELLGCFAMTETGHGSNVRGLETTATYDPITKEIEINTPNVKAGKEYIGNALHGRMATVFAQLIVNGDNQGVHAVLVPLRDKHGRLLPGIRVEDCGYKLGLNGVDNGRIWFDHVRVPKDNLLNRFGDIDEQGRYISPIENPSRRFFTMLGTLVGGRVCVPRAGLSAAKSGLTIAVRYALKRRQFSSDRTELEMLIMDYPSHQRRLMPLLAKAYATDFALTYLTKRYVNRSEEDIREIETLAAGLKSYATWFTTECLQECREACGGKGYLSENRFADLKADTDIFTTFEGDNTVLMQLVAKGVLSEFRKEFHEEGTMAILRYLGDRVTTAFTELNPIVIRNTDREHLLDTEFYLSAFRFRERSLLYSLADRMRSMIKDGMSSYDAFLKGQTHMINLAEAYVERITIEQFVKVVEEQEDEDTKRVLKDLCSLYALHTIESHKGWYMEKEYIMPVKSKAIRRMVDELCATIREDAAELVDAFDIPEECLAAEIVSQ